ncbi:excinuclease ABC subunit UvrC [Dysosmobacter sp.]|uniref:excinuclease ABC subunit UvrC n=1 Tax=Dysosmobacter sp. TaxID=2591382 RepID=UPI003AF1134E
MTKDELREKANDLPLQPGVYLMMDKTGKVIYVGKAKKLKNRVSQYFQDSAAHSVKTRQMVSQVNHFDTIFVTSEFEALVLENSLIKRHMPRYNILLKDDKGYPLVRLSRGRYPKFTLVNRPANDGAKYFGPFGGRYETRQAVDAVCQALRLPTCRRQFPRDIGAERPCLNFHMGRCDGFCRPEMPEAEYDRRMEQAAQLLEGRSKQLLRDMTAEMEAEAEALRFEQAAQLRDRIQAISALSKKQTVIAGLCADTDVWGVFRGAGKSGYAVLHMENGDLVGRETELLTAPMEESAAELLAAVTAQYYLPRAILPHEILLCVDTGDCEELSEALTQRAGHKVWVHVPQRGEKSTLADMAVRNAQEEVRRATTAEEKTAYTLEALQKMLNLPQPPRRMESFDISNTGASDIVASMVVYQGAKPLKSAYRRFQIKELTGGHPDDYGSMREVLRRRLQRAADEDEKFLPLPDVFLIDGGVTHADAVREVAEQFDCTVPIFGMVKDDRHRTRALVTPEGREIGIVNDQAVFSLIGQIQEETHRFAITYHHQHHTKSAMRSALDGVPGLGPKRQAELRKHFGTVKAIREADETALAAVLPQNVAHTLWIRLHEKEST